MPTVEERLAALEARMAAWIDQQPTNYYTHQYSGEEIDAAVGRALTGGALDTSVTNVSNQLGTFTRPNLLDNWYFGNPVDQQGGYIVPKGVNYYKVDGFVPQGPIPETVKVDHIDYAGSAIFNYGGVPCYVPKDGGYVRGYTGAWSYTIDRWQLGDGNISLSVADGGIALKGGGVVGSDYIFTRVERLPVAKYTYTILFSGNTDQVALSSKLTDTGVVTVVTSRAASGVLSLTWDQTTEFTSSDAFLRIHAPGSVNILAAKLELGSTQTLAHREGDRWVLNEVPDYGEQLRRCQLYSNMLPGIYWLPQNADGTNRLTIPIPDMRTIPAVTYEPTDGSTGTLYYDANLAQKNSIQFYAIGVTGICGVKNIRISADL